VHRHAKTRRRHTSDSAPKHAEKREQSNEIDTPTLTLTQTHTGTRTQAHTHTHTYTHVHTDTHVRSLQCRRSAGRPARPHPPGSPPSLCRSCKVVRDNAPRARRSLCMCMPRSMQPGRPGWPRRPRPRPETWSRLGCDSGDVQRLPMYVCSIHTASSVPPPRYARTHTHRCAPLHRQGSREREIDRDRRLRARRRSFSSPIRPS
jgi:hypothetical protein